MAQMASSLVIPVAVESLEMHFTEEIKFRSVA